MPERLANLTLQGVVHDLNNVFETLFEANDILKTDPKYTKLCATMLRTIKHGARIVKSLETQGGLTDAGRLMDQGQALLNDFLVASRGPAIEVIPTIEPNLQIPGTRGAWERVLLNLLLNAARMMPQGGTISVHMKTTKAGVEIQVLDTGPGIPAKVLPNLFEPGFTTTPRHKGLGLHIVSTIVESQGGTVTAANREDCSGACFTILLPR
ncbi:MAG: HAMP domain-containing histidine kinase [Acidobacteria bacterium]|nr:HAMP domain-containing histidine kinase [Acidobacteriota bacterium]